MIDLDLRAEHVVQITGAAFAAVAAIAAWASVRQGQRIFRAGVEPDIHMQVLVNVGRANQCDLVVTNTGGGTAKGTAYQLAASGARVQGFIADGFLAPGDKVMIQTTVRGDESAEATVLYRTADESSWAVTRDGRKKRLRRGRKGPATPGDAAWRTMHPSAKWDSLQFGNTTTIWLEKRGTVLREL